MLLAVAVLAASFALAAVATLYIRQLALRFHIVDEPGEPRKIHTTPTPLLGGLALYITFVVVALVLALTTQKIIGKDVSWLQLGALVLGGGLIMFGGWRDDKSHLTPAKQLIWPMAAALIVVLAGIGPRSITNPFGGTVQLAGLWVPVFAFIWLLGMMYTTKLLDGLDGLATGIGAIGSLIIFGLTQFTPFYQPSVGLLALTLAGACLGFLLWNWHPAKIFLGEGGSLFIGFVLGVLAIISGAKIATTLLVMGIPILDVAWVILRRVFWEKKSLAAADRKHLHYRLLDVGLSHRQSVTFLYFITATFGVTSIFLGTQGKVRALGALTIVMLLLAWFLVWWYKDRQNKKEDSL